MCLLYFLCAAYSTHNALFFDPFLYFGRPPFPLLSETEPQSTLKRRQTPVPLQFAPHQSPMSVTPPQMNQTIEGNASGLD